MSATDPAGARWELEQRGIVDIVAERDEAIAERDAARKELEQRRAAGKQLDGVIVRLSDENTELRAERDAAHEALRRIVAVADREPNCVNTRDAREMEAIARAALALTEGQET